ncbi:MAG: NERD domain-containing protein [Bacilli bacterium]|nr:NERD domain-containing protein [Bacilli bacterium]
MILTKNLNPQQIIFIIIASLVGLVIIFLLVFFPLKRKYDRKHYRFNYHKMLYNIATLDDYYLIYDFKFKTDSSHTATIDEILIGEKYFYIITCLYFEGELTGKETDSSLIYIPKIGARKYTDNPLLETKKMINALSSITGIDKSMMLGVILVNNNCDINVIPETRKDGSAIKDNEKIYYIVKQKNFPKFIKRIESRDIGTINEEQLARVVKGIDKLNRRKR